MPGAAAVMGSDLAREDWPTNLPPAAAGLRAGGGMNKQRGDSCNSAAPGRIAPAEVYPVRRGRYQTTANSASWLCSAGHERGGEGTSQQQGPEGGPAGGLAWLPPRSAASRRANATRVLQLPSPAAGGYSGSCNKSQYPLATRINTSAVVREGFPAGERLRCLGTCCGFPEIWKEFLGCRQ